MPEDRPPPIYKAPNFPSPQYEILEWLLTGVSETDGDADHYENEDWYIKRILSNDPLMTISAVTTLVSDYAPKEAQTSRATIGRFLKPLKSGDYNDHIAQRCNEMGIDVGNVFPGSNPKAELTDKGWLITGD